jgi:hypothetical protein
MFEEVQREQRKERRLRVALSAGRSSLVLLRLWVEPQR